MGNIFYVYLYLRSNNSKYGITGSPYYVGKGKGGRVLSTNRKITRRPTNPANIVFFATDLTEWDAHQLEMLLIYRFGRIDIGTGSLRNLTDGGEGMSGYIQSPGHIAKRVASQVGKRLLPEHKAKLSAWQIGRVLSPEHKLKISQSRKGQSLSDETRAKLVSAKLGCKNHFFGKHHSPETKAKLRAAKRRVIA
jgi:hypothetical protein